MKGILFYFYSPMTWFGLFLVLVMLYLIINRPKTDEEEEIITTEVLRKEMNEERQKEGLYEIPAINSRSGGNSYARMDDSFKSVPDFFKQLIFGKKKK